MRPHLTFLGLVPLILQILGDAGELFQGGFEICGDDLGRGEVGTFFQGFQKISRFTLSRFMSSWNDLKRSVSTRLCRLVGRRCCAAASSRTRGSASLPTFPK